MGRGGDVLTQGHLQGMLALMPDLGCFVNTQEIVYIHFGCKAQAIQLPKYEDTSSQVQYP